MKKIFVLALSLGTITTVFAQGRYNDKNNTRDVILGTDNHGVVYNNNKSGNDNRYDAASNDFRRKEAIDKVNRDYDFQVAAVKRNRYMKRNEKDRQIQRLDRERAAKIRDINERYSNKNGHYNDRDNRKF